MCRKTVTHIVDADNERKDGPGVFSGDARPILLVLLQVIVHKMRKEKFPIYCSPAITL
jgi:hypothetical protein